MTSSESSAIPFLVPHYKVWLTPTARVPCSNAANIEHHKTWRQTELCTWENSVIGQEPPKRMYSVPAQQMAKHCAKFGWSPLRCQWSNEAKMRNPTKFAGVPQTHQPISAVSGPEFTILLWGHVEEILLSNKFFFRSSIHALVAKIQPDNIVRRCPDGVFLHNFCIPYFQPAACSTFQTCILHLH